MVSQYVERFREAKQLSGWTQEAIFLAYRDIGGRASMNSVSNWLRGSQKPGADDLFFMFRVLNHALSEAGPDPIFPEFSVVGDSGSSSVGRRGIEPRTY